MNPGAGSASIQLIRGYRRIEAVHFVRSFPLFAALLLDFLSVNGAAPTVMITSPAPDDIVVSGSNVTLSAEVQGDYTRVWDVSFYEAGNPIRKIGTVTNAPYQLSWSKTGFGPYCLTADAAVEYSNMSARVGSEPVTVHLVPELGFPAVIRAPQHQIVSLGNNISLTVQPAGQAPFRYQWWFNGAPIADATNSTLVLTNVQPDKRRLLYRGRAKWTRRGCKHSGIFGFELSRCRLAGIPEPPAGRASFDCRAKIKRPLECGVACRTDTGPVVCDEWPKIDDVYLRLFQRRLHDDPGYPGRRNWLHSSVDLGRDLPDV